MVGMAGSLEAAPCTVAPLSTYLNPGFSCTIDDVLFENFGVVVAGVLGGQPDAFDDISVSPSGSNFDPNLSFAANYSTGFAQTSSFLVAFTVTAPQDFRFTGLTMSVSNANVTGGLTGGTLLANETVCLNGAFNPITDVLGCTGVLTSLDAISSAAGNLSATVSLDLGTQNITQLGIIKTIALEGGLGTATASALNNGFSLDVPEPASLAMMTAGLGIVMGTARRRRRQRIARS